MPCRTRSDERDARRRPRHALIGAPNGVDDEELLGVHAVVEREAVELEINPDIDVAAAPEPHRADLEGRYRGARVLRCGMNQCHEKLLMRETLRYRKGRNGMQ